MILLITGANRGLGYEIAAEALERGHSVIAGVRNPGEMNEKLANLSEKHGNRLVISAMDVTDETSISNLAFRMKQEGKGLDAVINNAAILNARNTHIEDLDMKDVALTFEINLYGPMRVVKHFLPLLTNSGASVINISSEAGSISNAYPGDYPYAISKTALNMFTQQLLAYVKDRGIQVLSIHPGWMKTDMGGENAPTDPRESARGILEQIEGKIVPDGRFNFVDAKGKAMQI